MKGRPSRTVTVAALVFAAGVLIGCENEVASFQDAAQPGQSLTLIREQRFFWDNSTEVAIVVARFPDCQRRHGLGASARDEWRVDVHRAVGRAYLIKARDTWYFADAQTCQLEEVEAPAAGEEGKIVGAFDQKKDRFKFVPTEPEPDER
jgi:hypothetical protein